MRTALRLCLIALAAFTLAACATVADSYVVSNKLLSGPPERKGMVVGSVGISKTRPPYQRYSLVARELSTGEEVRFYFKRAGFMDTPVDFDDSRAESALFALQLPEGRYEIRNFEFFAVGVFGSEFRETARQDFSMPFEIKTGQATYLGEFIVMPLFGKNLFGRTVVVDAYWEIGDQQGRDVALARKRMPDMPLDQVTAMVPDPGRLGLPFMTRAGATPPRQSAIQR